MDSKKNKEDWLTIRIGVDLKNSIKHLVDDGAYPDMSTFVMEAITEKLDPSKRKITDFNSQLKRALAEDPTILDEPLKRIGLQFYARK